MCFLSKEFRDASISRIHIIGSVASSKWLRRVLEIFFYQILEYLYVQSEIADE